MPSLKEIRKDYYFFTGKVSENVRALCFSAVAIIWVFKQETKGGMMLPEPLYWALLWVLVSLTMDFLQYFYGAVVWGYYSRIQEKLDPNQEAEYLAPRWFNWPTNAFYYLKVFFAVCVYLQIFRYLLDAIKPV